MGIIAVSGLGDLFVSGFVAISDAVEAAMQLGTDIPRIAMAVTRGESWTNAIQPLYAIPVLTVAGLHIRDVVGYGVIICALNGTIYLTGLLFF